ncbi:MAG: hypothetical protein U0V74_16845 [Chitinophagales bacterium]
MPKFLFTAVIALSFLTATAQQVSKESQDDFVRSANQHGNVLEKSIMPDFTKAHPNRMQTTMACFPGKKMVINVLMAAKPSDLQFKVTIGSQVFKPKNDLAELTLGGIKCWVGGITIDMTNAPSGDYCMDLLAYDGNAIDLPVYIYFFSF